MGEVWIFGDSFAMPYEDDNTTWTSQLSEKYHVKNFAYGGTGPDWSLQQLLNQSTNKTPEQLSNITVIFLISSIMRFNFKTRDDVNHQVLTPNFQYGTKHEKKLYKKYRKEATFLKKFYKEYALHGTYCETEILKIIGYLNLLSHKYSKILVWSIFDDFEYPILDNDKIHVPDLLLSDIMMYEPYRSMKYKNHFTTAVHDILANEILNWIDNDTPIDTTKFLKNT